MANGTTTPGNDLAAFRNTLDTYGADRTRWPLHMRARFAALISESAEARAALADAAALDRLLDQAPEYPVQCVAALGDRLQGHVAIESAPVATRGRAFAIGRPAPLVGNVRPSVPRRPKVRDHDAWPVAGVLVASLVLGIFFGTSGVAMLAADPLRALLGGASDTSEDTFDLVLGTAVPAGEEELL